MLLVDAFDAVHLEAANKENDDMRRIYLFRFIFYCFISIMCLIESCTAY